MDIHKHYIPLQTFITIHNVVFPLHTNNSRNFFTQSPINNKIYDLSFNTRPYCL